MSTKFDAQRSDDELASEGDFDGSLAVMEPEDETPPERAEWTGPRCENCGAPMQAGKVTICRSCGWYASLGRCVEVDPDWDGPDAADETKGPVAAAPQLSHIRVWLNLLPRWAWVVIASMAAVVVESIVVRLATSAGIGGLRTTWSLSQLFLGVTAFVGCHIFNFLMQVSDDSDVGLLDVVLRPVKLWLRTARYLPAKLWLVNTAACGVTAATMSILVIGALPYDRLWDWGFQQPVKQNLMGAVLDRARKLDDRKGADNLEDAIADFAGSQDLEPGEEKPPAKPRERADCVIVGYQVDRDGRLEYLVLATAHNKKLVFAGKVNPQISESERAELLEQLSGIRVREPFIPIASDTAIWVQAKYACRVTFGERVKGGQLRDVQWENMLGTIRGR